MATYYQILELENDADHHMIRRQYLKMASIHHPDKASGNHEKFQQIQEAYECLSDPDKKAQYDMELTIYNQIFFNIAGGFIIPEDPINMMNQNLNKYTHISDENNIDQNNANIDLIMDISLIDVYSCPKKNIYFKRDVVVDNNNVIIKDLANIYYICNICRGNGYIINFRKNSFLVECIKNNCHVCESKGYIFMNGYKIINRKCECKRTLPYGIQNEDVFVLYGEGNVTYDKNKKKLISGDVIVTTKYNIDITNNELNNIYGFKNIYITDIYINDIEYVYYANLFEFITGTQFNLPLPNGQYLLIKINDLKINMKMIIPGYGLPINKLSKNIGNIYIIIKLKELLPEEIGELSKTDKLILKRIMYNLYQKPVSSGALIVNYN